MRSRPGRSALGLTPALDRLVHSRDVVAQRDLDLFVVDAVVGVRGDDPHALDLRQGISGIALMTSSGSLVANVAQPTDDGLSRKAKRALGIPAHLPQAHQFGCRVGGLSQICQKVFDSPGHRSTASARMWSSRGLRALRVTTSTPTPSSSSRSWNKPT